MDNAAFTDQLPGDDSGKGTGTENSSRRSEHEGLLVGFDASVHAARRKSIPRRDRRSDLIGEDDAASTVRLPGDDSGKGTVTKKSNPSSEYEALLSVFEKSNPLRNRSVQISSRRSDREGLLSEFDASVHATEKSNPLRNRSVQISSDLIGSPSHEESGGGGASDDRTDNREEDVQTSENNRQEDSPLGRNEMFAGYEEEDDTLLGRNEKRKGEKLQQQPKKKQKIPVQKKLPVRIDISSRKLVRSLIIKPDFFGLNSLDEMESIITAQKGWKELFNEEGDSSSKVSESLVREFYENLDVQGDSLLVADVYVNGKSSNFTSHNLAEWLNVEKVGYWGYSKGRWPTNIIVDGVRSKLSKFNRVTVAICLQLVQKLLIPRERDQNWRIEEASILDVLLVEKLLDKEPINLPALIMNHMRYAKESPNHSLPYPTIVKKILCHGNHYPAIVEREELGEILGCTPFGVGSLNRLGLVKSDGKWMFNISEHPPTTLDTICYDIGEIKDTLTLILKKLG